MGKCTGLKVHFTRGNGKKEFSQDKASYGKMVN